MRHNWPEMRVNQDVTRPRWLQTGDRHQTGSRLGVWGEWHWHWPVVSPGSPVTARGQGPPFRGVASRGLVMSPPWTWLITMSPFVPAWARCLSGLMISIVMTDAGGPGDHQPSVTAWFPRHCLAMHGSALFVLMDSGLTPRLVTTNIGGLFLVCCHRARYLMSSQTEKPITTLYPLQPLTLACERICYLHFLSVQIILKFKWCGM